MTDDHTAADELASAYLDREAAPDEVARVESDPVLRSRVADFEAVRDSLAVGAPPAGRRDDHVAAALAVFDEAAGGVAGTDGPASEGMEPAVPVTDLATRRRSLLHRIPLGAVAAGVAVLALIGALTQVDIDSGDDTDSAATATSDEASDEASGDDSASMDAGVDDSGDAAESSTTAPDALGDGTESSAREELQLFQAFSTTDDLADHIVARYDELVTQTRAEADEESAAGADDGEDQAPAEREVDPCDVVTTAGVDPEAVTVVLPAVVAGEPVTAVVAEDGDRRLVVVDDRSCSIVVDRPL